MLSANWILYIDIKTFSTRENYIKFNIRICQLKSMKKLINNVIIVILYYCLHGTK